METERIAFLLKRDGLEKTTEWVGRTRQIYLSHVESNKTLYTQEFVNSIAAFDGFLGADLEERKKRLEAKL